MDLVLGLLLLAVIMVVLFLLVGQRAKEPIFPLSLFHNDIFRTSPLVTFLAGAGMFGAILYIGLFVQGVFGQSATVSGGVLTPMMLSVVLVSIINGQFISRGAITGRSRSRAYQLQPWACSCCPK